MLNAVIVSCSVAGDEAERCRTIDQTPPPQARIAATRQANAEHNVCRETLHSAAKKYSGAIPRVARKRAIHGRIRRILVSEFNADT